MEADVIAFWDSSLTHRFTHGTDWYSREHVADIRKSAYAYGKLRGMRVNSYYDKSRPHRRLYVCFYGARQGGRIKPSEVELVG